MTEYHKLGSFNDRNALSHSPGGRKPERPEVLEAESPRGLKSQMEVL